MKKETIKAFAFFINDNGRHRSKVIIEHSKFKASQLILKVLESEGLDFRAVELIIRLKRTKKNAHFFTEQFIKEQKAHINGMLERSKEKQDNE